MVLPLDGIKVVELGIWVAGPACARILGELGADVIKIENPRGGDPARGLVSAGADKDTPNPFWELYNGSKRSIAVDLTQAAGKEIVYKLMKASDVL
jgi:formyl-CoA transferase